MECSMVGLYIAFSALALFTSIRDTVGTDDFNIVATERNLMRNRQTLSSEVLNRHGACSSAPLPPLPVGVTDSASVFFRDHLMICGGNNWTNWTSDLEKVSWTSSCYGLESNAASSSWKTLPSLNIARSSFILTKAGDAIYAVGGFSVGYDSLDSIEKNSGEGWELMKAKIPNYQYVHCTVHLKTTNSLILMSDGGEVDSLDLSTLEWSSLPPLPVYNLWGFGCAAVEDAGEEKILVTGGWRPWPQDRSPEKCYGWAADGQFQSQVYSYSGTTWSQAGQLTRPRAYHTMAVLDGRPLVLGGDDGDLEHCQVVRNLSLERMGQGGIWEKLPAAANMKEAYDDYGGPSIYTVATVPANKFPCFD